jgi:formate hydrogenlyase subunit 6/NADH:ubiquinone oxidoreductase subunit I
MLAAAVFLVLAGPAPAWIGRVLPGLSPLATFSAMLGHRDLSLGLFWALPPLAVLVLSLFRGRLFCLWACPLGTLQAGIAQIGARVQLIKRPVRAFVFWMILTASACGAPIVLMLDPLSSTQRALIVAKGVAGWAAWVPGLLVPAILLLGLAQPMLWCSRLCPLGYLLDQLQVRRADPGGRLRRDRRQIIGGGVAGLCLAAVAPRLPAAGRAGGVSPVLPPGARAAPRFGVSCSRCGACVDVCPTQVIRMRWSVDQSAAQWFEPELDFRQGVCDPSCVACTEVCPTRSIIRVEPADKRAVVIGEARVVPEACLPFHEGVACTVCFNRCPMNAIEMVAGSGGVVIPSVVLSRCNGCGYCEHYCPAWAGRGVVVDGIPRPRRLELDSDPA